MQTKTWLKETGLPPAPVRVVLAPDVIGKSFLVPECKDVLDLWRDGAIMPVVTRDLLARYVKVLRGLRIPDSLIRDWILWLTAQGRSLHLPDAATSGTTAVQVLWEAARSGGASSIITARQMDADGKVDGAWKTVGEFLKSSMVHVGWVSEA